MQTEQPENPIPPPQKVQIPIKEKEKAKVNGNNDEHEEIVFSIEHQSEIVRNNGLGTLNVLTDALIMKVLKKLPQWQFLLDLALVSKAMHQFANLNDIWRHFCVERWDGDIFFRINWKLTTIFSRDKVIPPQLIPHPDKPQLKGFYSDTMYKKWWHSQMQLNGWTHDSQPVIVDRISINTITPKEFREKYMIPNRPVILTDVVQTWPSWQNQSWTPEALQKRFLHHTFKIGEYNSSGRRIKMSMGDYVWYMNNNIDAKPLYIFDSKFADKAPELLDDYIIPEMFWEDLFSCMEGSYRPPYRWLVMGPQRSGTPFHIDPHRTSAWNALLHGTKRWAFYPPGWEIPPGVKTDLSGPHPLVWWTHVYPTLPPHLKPIEVTQYPGDFLYVPSGWWHSIINLNHTVAVTQNFVNMDNLEAVIGDLVHSGNTKLVNYWKKKLQGLRPELFKVISEKQYMFEGDLARQELERKKEKYSKRKEMWSQMKDNYEKEIEELKQKLAAATLAQKEAPQNTTPSEKQPIKDVTQSIPNGVHVNGVETK